ncbi:MAG: hypothetical protein ABW022_15975 [Actinoplanes sp.]
MSDRYGSVRQLPCPDCGSPVQPEREQLCPRCGYPLMFLRQNGSDDSRAQSIPRSPNERDDPTTMRARTDTRQFPAAVYGTQAPAAGEAPCRNCGYPNAQVRVRCERCGNELRPARPQARVLAPPVPEKSSRRGGGWGWLIVLIVLAVLALLVLAGTLVWWFLV